MGDHGSNNRTGERYISAVFSGFNSTYAFRNCQFSKKRPIVFTDRSRILITVNSLIVYIVSFLEFSGLFLFVIALLFF